MGLTVARKDTNTTQITPEQLQALESAIPWFSDLNEDQKNNIFGRFSQEVASLSDKSKKSHLTVVGSKEREEKVENQSKEDIRKHKSFTEKKQSYKKQNEEKIKQLQDQLSELNEDNKVLSTNERWPIAQAKYALIFDRQADKVSKFEKDFEAGMRYVYYSKYPVWVRHLAKALNKSGFPFMRENPKKVIRRFQKFNKNIDKRATSDRQKLVAKKLKERYGSVYTRYAKQYNEGRTIKETLE